ncbi:MAG TPA: fumarylacetoacetate hydrolase family protein [Amaricoccus sp.]|mgnify:CR=1 FL=1|uniref:fumarylacetoacetate hydrolase family protein n=1 Tax=Amaricoccus sp. TaxID=1872485 RepID=UPI002CC666DC|nr:fumarylacetoacetate hydrolase family protein [Amaricoccus sp.]HMQ95005.1 fumarylacetoacetate hydrolase family protein [Amaricoccus sp.]HMR37810.1 fumarylacetoacetate hydrolase family protein [Paracoccus sp. (in: a-proteobacteria)]HMR54808.1 fumarylacetoacetate hydrolase family protein [Amaricoccus sp.]HMU01850.1 fumarylacetoacetate hydrolase family protein [Amaricoccus sp.]
MLSDQNRQYAADAILAAEKTRKVCPQPSATWPEMTLEDAYDVQRRWAEARIAAGAKIVGRKIGLTSRAMQQASKMTEPDYGVILDDALFQDGARIAAGTFIKPRLEVELAFVMGSDLSGAGCHIHDVMRATEFVQPALEIIDYRTEVPRQIVDTIADNAAFGAIVLGGRTIRPFDVDLRRVGATLSQNGVIEESGLAAAVMGHPAAGLAWLVSKLAAQGDGLKAGDIVLGGAFARPVDIRPGDVIAADYGDLGSIGVSFA